MFNRIFKRILKKQIENSTKEIEKNLSKKLRMYVTEDCYQIVKELFSETKDKEYVFSFWSGQDEIDTLIGSLKKQIAHSTSAEFDRRHKKDVLEFINGEEFIDKVVTRINKKQISS